MGGSNLNYRIATAETPRSVTSREGKHLGRQSRQEPPVEGRRHLGTPPGRLEVVIQEIADLVNQRRLAEDRGMAARRRGDADLKHGYDKIAQMIDERIEGLEHEVREAGRKSA